MSLQRLNKFVRCSANYNVCRYVKSQLEFSQFLRLSVNSKNFSTGQNMSSNQKVLNLDNMNPNVRIMEYAVRGPLLIRATEIENELKKVCIFLFYFYFLVFLIIFNFRVLKNLLKKCLKQILVIAMQWDKSQLHSYARYSYILSLFNGRFNSNL